MARSRQISLRGVEVHNLQSIDLDLPHGQLIVFCGVSGSGKSSLAFDTLYAEGQRRYIESFSAYTRQFLDRLEKPAAESIEGIPPAIAVTSQTPSRSTRSTVGTATEISDHLRLLFARIGHVFCQNCGQEVRRENPQTVAQWLARLQPQRKFMIAFAREAESTSTPAEMFARLREEGFVRAIWHGQTITLSDAGSPPVPAATETSSPIADSALYVVVDRLSTGAATERIRESLEQAFSRGGGRCVVFVDADANLADAAKVEGAVQTELTQVDGQTWQRSRWSTALECDRCGQRYPEPEPRLFSFNSPLGACETCEGFGNTMDIDMSRVVPDPNKTLREGAVAPWNTPAYAHELTELLALAGDYDVPADVPFAQLSPQAIAAITHGVAERKFGGLDGFFAWLERRKYKMHIRVFLSRWRSHRRCVACGGTRLKPEALATQISGQNIAQISNMEIREAAKFFAALQLPEWEQTVGAMMLDQVKSRLSYLQTVGLGYLTLDRTLRTLSGGEAQRVALTSALGSSLVHMLYVLDEPSVGLHPSDTDRLVTAVARLRQRGNTVVVVEHEEAMIRAADQVVEIGPGAGQQGGRVVFQGPPAELEKHEGSLTGDYLAGRRRVSTPQRRRAPNHGWMRLTGARGNNLRNLTVEFPLGTLCVVSGVSGAGKSSLIEDTLYPAICRRLQKECGTPLEHDDLFGDGQIDDVLMVDQSPIGRSPRSNPVTSIKAFDEIRAVFADTVEARTRNYTASYFSFNVEGGRCNACEGDGYRTVDMQFLADIYVKCPQCGGTRYRHEILQVRYRGRNIAEVLMMTVREAFTFFRGHPKVQARLKQLMDVGLDYIRLGQPANTLSGGEAQRLRLASYMSSVRRGKSLFILDEPTTGLHFSDVVQLLDCFEALLAVGHSLIVVEHNLQVIKCADYIIDLGPGAADQGGQVVAHGTPEIVVRQSRSVTGRYLAQAMAEDQQEQTA